MTAGVALGDIYLRFAWQSWHLRHSAGSGGALGRAWLLSTFVLHGRRSTYGTRLALVARLVAVSLCVVGVALGDIHLRSAWQAWHIAWQAWHLATSTCVLRGRCGTNFSHATLSHTTLSHTIFHHTIFHTQLCHTPFFATPSSAHHFDTPSFTHNFVTHTIFLCHTPSFTYSCVTHNFFKILDPPPPPLSFLPSPSPLQHLLLIVGRS